MMDDKFTMLRVHRRQAPARMATASRSQVESDAATRSRVCSKMSNKVALQMADALDRAHARQQEIVGYFASAGIEL